MKKKFTCSQKQLKSDLIDIHVVFTPVILWPIMSHNDNNHCGRMSLVSVELFKIQDWHQDDRRRQMFPLHCFKISDIK